MNSRAIIRITALGKDSLSINYSRRMYAIIRRYTREAVEGGKNECFAELTGLRRFFKMTYQEISEKILEDLYTEIGVRFRVRVAKTGEFEAASGTSISKKPKNISTYKEINKLFVGKSFVDASKRTTRIASTTPPRLIKRVRLTVPFLGKVQ
jgi:hypothetical protein